VQHAKTRHAARWVHKNPRRYFTPEAQPHEGSPNIIEESFQAFSLMGAETANALLRNPEYPRIVQDEMTNAVMINQI
jgi:hypothetical protein